MAREARSPGDRCTLSSPRETQRRRLWILGGGDQLRAGTMFLATLYFALPLLGKSRPLLAFFLPRVFQRGSLAAATRELRCGYLGFGWKKFRWDVKRFKRSWVWGAAAAQLCAAGFILLC